MVNLITAGPYKDDGGCQRRLFARRRRQCGEWSAGEGAGHVQDELRLEGGASCGDGESRLVEAQACDIATV